MSPISNIIIATATAAIVSGLIFHSNAIPVQTAKPNVYERVINSGVLRCGYFVEPPFTIIDPNTGAKSGIAVELAEKIAEELNLKIEWRDASNFVAMTEDLKNGRFDAICASTFNLPRAGRIDYTMPYAFVPVYGVTKAGRTEFDNRLDHLDWSKISIAGLDGEGATTVARKKIPEAHFVILPPSTPIPDMMLSVVAGKADIAFVPPAMFRDFDKNNPRQLRLIANVSPFHVFNVSFGLKPDEPAFKNMLDIQMRALVSSGYLEALFKKYDPDRILLRPAAPFHEIPMKQG
jgi:ABC-type amino acid transport substrate-binding protein